MIKNSKSLKIATPLLLTAALALAGATGLPAASRGNVVYARPVASITGDEFDLKLKDPTALFYDEAKSRLYVADTGNKRLVSFDEKFELLAELIHADMSMPTSIVKTKGAKFIVTDSMSGELKFVDPAGELVESVTLTGVPRAEHAIIPGRLSIDGGGDIYVVDKMNARVIAVDEKGSFKRAYTGRGEGFYGFNDLRATEQGELFVLDSIGKTVYFFKADGTLALSFSVAGKDRRSGSFPTSLAIGPNGFVYILDAHSGKVVVYDRTGEFQYSMSRKGFNVGELYHPSYIIINRAGRLFITDGMRVQVLEEVKQ